MRVWLLIRSLLLMSLFVSPLALAQSVAFNADVFKEIKKSYQDKQWLMVLWSVDCPPCFKELTLIKNLRKIQPNINVVIVNTDGEAEANSQSESVMADFQLSNITTYYFEEDSAARNRFVIDPTWYGELPRSYFVDADGKFNGKSGLIDAALLKKWLL